MQVTKKQHRQARSKKAGALSESARDINGTPSARESHVEGEPLHQTSNKEKFIEHVTGDNGVSLKRPSTPQSDRMQDPTPSTAPRRQSKRSRTRRKSSDTTTTSAVLPVQVHRGSISPEPRIMRLQVEHEANNAYVHTYTVLVPHGWDSIGLTRQEKLDAQTFFIRLSYDCPALQSAMVALATNKLFRAGLVSQELFALLTLDSTSKLSKSLMSPAQKKYEGIIMAIGVHAFIEFTFGDPGVSKTHRLAQHSIINHQGGFEAIDILPQIKHGMRLADRLMSEGSDEGILPPPALDEHESRAEASPLPWFINWMPEEYATWLQDDRLPAGTSRIEPVEADT